jgi:hypothetical protein
MSRSKDIGTKAETQVVRYLIPNGFPQAERRALRGIRDVGDITGTPGIVWEVKGGEAARQASDNQIDLWLAETELERDNAHEHLGFLIIARARHNVRDWWAVCWADQLAWLVTTDPGRLGGEDTRLDPARITPVRTTLARLVVLLRAAGWGDPIDSQETPA